MGLGRVTGIGVWGDNKMMGDRMMDERFYDFVLYHFVRVKAAR
jgi:hypothetical protein